MKRILLAISLFVLTTNSHAYEASECDGISTWGSVSQNSPDVMMRTCNLFGMNFIEIKSKLSENRCIAIENKETGDQWKSFFLHRESIKALANPYFNPAQLAIESKKVEGGRCNS
jgi:hypothetical protein